MLLQKKVNLFLESLNFFVIVHAKIQMNCGLFFAPIFYLIVLKSKLLNTIMQMFLTIMFCKEH